MTISSGSRFALGRAGVAEAVRRGEVLVEEDEVGRGRK
jgi:hypothetical protein